MSKPSSSSITRMMAARPAGHRLGGRGAGALVGAMLLLGLVSPVAGGKREPRPVTEVLGIGPGMTEREAHRRLEKIGKLELEKGLEQEGEREGGEGEGGAVETWSLRDRRFRFVVITVDRDKRVYSIQGFARPGGPRLRYTDFGDLTQAKKLGYYIYAWNLPAAGQRPALAIQARGSDSLLIGSYMIVRR